MGHAYELQVPRGRPEWATSLQIQRDFPPSVGCSLAILRAGLRLGHGRPGTRGPHFWQSGTELRSSKA